MSIDLPQHIIDNLFHQHEDERERIREGIKSVMLMKYWTTTSYRRRKEIGWKSVAKRKHGKKFSVLKF
tara:strand:- start:187 stop:390 length:204 start_codon:yes stop_codon:yes gene_type:complete